MRPIRDKLVLGVAELGVLRILDGRMTRDRVERTVLKHELSKSSATVADAIESLIRKKLVRSLSGKRLAKSIDDFVGLTYAGKALRKALMIGKFM
jgi:hypothetical protein